MGQRSGRRGWIAGIVPALADEVAERVEARVGAEPPARPRRRPPGAAPEAELLRLCTGCGACVEACPHQAVFTFLEGAGRLAGTPLMKPDERACHQCEGFPCAAACETGALRVPEGRLWPLGIARIRRDRCLPFRGPECGACAGLCPREGPEALPALRMAGVWPTLAPERCVGCGLCIEACPTTPKAIELLPLEASAYQDDREVCDGGPEPTRG